MRRAGARGENLEQMYNLNLRTVTLQGERYLKTSKAKVEWLLRDFVFRAHTAIAPGPAAVLRALGFQFCSM